MRFTNLLALAAVTTAATHTASAQTESRVRVSTPAVAYSVDRGEPEHRAALGVGTTTTGTPRDTLGLMITSVTKGSPAEKAGLEEGNRIAAINGVSLRINAADVEDGDMSSAFTRRLTRELGKSKPGDEVELKVYRDGHTQTIKVKTADSSVLFARSDEVRITKTERDNRPALGFGIGNTGSRRDTLGVLVMSVPDSTPAAKAGLEEGNRIAAINGVSLRVAREDAGDHWLGSTKVQRLQREIAALKPGDNVTLKVYSNGQFRDVTLKVARAGDLPRSGAMMFMGDAFMGAMSAMPAMPRLPNMPMTRMAPMAPMKPMAPMPPMDGFRIEISPEFRQDLEEVRVQLNNIRPQIERSLDPQLDRLRIELPRALEQLRSTPRLRVVNVIV
jgi:serine protease Do